jgi:hypothetical protein
VQGVAQRGDVVAWGGVATSVAFGEINFAHFEPLSSGVPPVYPRGVRMSSLNKKK